MVGIGNADKRKPTDDLCTIKEVYDEINDLKDTIHTLFNSTDIENILISKINRIEMRLENFIANINYHRGNVEDAMHETEYFEKEDMISAICDALNKLDEVIDF